MEMPNLNIYIAFKTTNTLGRFIKNCKDKTDKVYPMGRVRKKYTTVNKQ